MGSAVALIKICHVRRFECLSKEGINFARWSGVGLKNGGGGCDWFLLFFVVVALGSHPCSILSKELHMRSEVWRVAEPFIRCRWF